MSDSMKRLSSVLAVLCTLALAILLAVLAGLVLFTVLAGLPDLVVSQSGRAGEAGPLLRLQEVLLIVLFAIAVMPGAFALWFMRRLFVQYAAGEVFSEAAAFAIRRIGQMLILGALTAVIVGTVASAVGSYDDQTGNGSMSVEFASHDMMFVLLGGLLFVIGAAMGDAARLEADNRSIV